MLYPQACGLTVRRSSGVHQVASRLSAMDTLPMSRALGFGARYLKEHYPLVRHAHINMCSCKTHTLTCVHHGNTHEHVNIIKTHTHKHVFVI